MYEKELKTLKQTVAEYETKLAAIYAAIEAIEAQNAQNGSGTETKAKTGKAGDTSFRMSGRTIPAAEPDNSELQFRPITGAPVGVNVGGGGLRSDRA